jgi:hypothetical protein
MLYDECRISNKYGWDGWDGETKLRRSPEGQSDEMDEGDGVYEVTEYNVGVRTWLQLMCCALAARNGCP